MQRLFSTFAGGWPGVGLLLQRLLTAILLIRFGIMQPSGTSFSSSVILELVCAGAAIFLLLGLWTPIVGALIAVIELWFTMTHLNDPWASIVLATLSGTVAMIGPGAWSIDARLFGRKHIAT